MNWKWHLGFGIIFSVVLLIIFFPAKFYLLLLVPLYALLPDIDHKNSKITWFFLGIAILGLTLSVPFCYLNAPFFGINTGILLLASFVLLLLTFVGAVVFPHRGFTHSIIFGVIVSFPLLFFNCQSSIFINKSHYDTSKGIPSQNK